jgi:predicted RNA-binding protein with TRAM domain
MKKIITLLLANFLLMSSLIFAKPVACPTVTDFKTTSITTTSAVIYWGGLSGVKSYDVVVSQAFPIPIVPIIFEFKGVTTTKIMVEKLVPGTTYTYFIKTNCSDGTSSPISKLDEFTTLNSTTGGGGTTNDCGTVTSVSFAALGTSGSGTLKWSDVSGAISYNVTIFALSTSSSTPPFKLSTTSKVNYLDLKGLPTGTKFSVTVQAICAKGGGNNSAPYTFETPGTTTGGGGTSTDCGAVTNLSFKASATTGEGTLKWTGITGALSYNVTVSGYSSSPFTPPFYFKTTTKVDSVSLKGLPAGTKFTATIQAICSKGIGNTVKYNFETSGTAGTGCGSIKDVAASPIDSTSAMLKWSTVNGATSYEIQVTGPKGFTATYTSKVASVTATKLPGAGNYTFKVRAICANGNGDWSKTGTFFIKPTVIVPPTTACGTVKSVKITVKDTATADISWTPVMGAKSYEIEITGAGTGVNITLTSTTASVTATKLLTNSTYFVRIRVICTSGISDWSKGYEFKTPKAVVTPPTASCGIPNGLGTKVFNTTTAQLLWNPIPGALSYDVEIEELTPGSTSASIKVSAKIPTVIIDNFKLGTSYQFKVRAVCDKGNSDWSKYVVFVLKSKLPNPNDNSDGTVSGGGSTTDLIRSIYPNPSNGDVNITLNGKEGEGKLLIMNMLGSVVMSADVNAGETRQINVSDFSAGYYFVKVKIGVKTDAKRLVITK